MEDPVKHIQILGRGSRPSYIEYKAELINVVDLDGIDPDVIFLDEASDFSEHIFGWDYGVEPPSVAGYRYRPLARAPDEERIWLDPSEPVFKHGPKGGRAQRIARRRAANKAARKARRK